MNKYLIKIIKHYGFNSQIRKFNEEVLELSEQLFIIDWLNDYKKNLTPRQYKSMYDARIMNVEEEFADVLVLLEQFKRGENENAISYNIWQRARTA